VSRLLALLAAGDPGFVASNYMPDVKVEIAFTSGYTTPAADRVWTDVSEWVELEQGITDTFGRQDERSTADANDLTLTLDNSDGRFTAGRSASPYYPKVKIGRPIRLSLMTVTGHTSVRFVGFIDEWPVEWDGTDAYAKASIRATSRLARLGLSQKLRSVVELAVLADSPALYWPLSDPSGAVTAAEMSGNGGDPMTAAGSGTAVVFGNAVGPSVDGLSATEFAAGQYLTWGGSVAALSFTFSIVTSTASQDVFDTDNMGTWEIDASGKLTGFGFTPIDYTLTSTTTVSDGSLHDIAVVMDGATARLYVDGIQEDTGTGVSTPITRIDLGDGYTGTIAHFAIYETALTAGQIAIQSEATRTGFAGDRTDERLLRILGWAGVAASEVTTETGAETMTYQLTSGQSVVDALRDVESTESGVLFDGRDGNVTFHNRSRRYLAPIAVTFDMAAQQVEADYAPKLDRSTLANDVTVDNPTTSETARSVDAASVDEYGTASSSAKSVAETYDALQQKAAWLVASYAEPRPRVPSLTVDVLAQVGGSPSAEDILALTIGSRIRVTNQPAQADATTADYFVEGYSETIGPESYRITFNLSPAHPSLSTFVLDDATRGVLDSSYVLAL
jgi:hypothetical protein